MIVTYDRRNIFIVQATEDGKKLVKSFQAVHKKLENVNKWFERSL
jgi:hypothetical protein